MLIQRVKTLEEDCGDIKGTVKSIDKSLSALVRLEAHHNSTRDGLGRAFTEISKLETATMASIKTLDDRLRLVELELPTLKLVRGWIVLGVLGVMSLVGVAIFKLIGM